MYNEQFNGQEHWQQLITEADEYRRARDAKIGKKKPTSMLRRVLSNILGSVTS